MPLSPRWYNFFKTFVSFSCIKLDQSHNYIPLDRSHTHKSLCNGSFLTLGFCWGTMSLSFQEGLPLTKRAWKANPYLLKGTFGWLHSSLRHHLWFLRSWKDFPVTTLASCLELVFLKVPPNLIFAQKPFLNFSIMCHLQKLGIFKNSKSWLFLFTSPAFSFSVLAILLEATGEQWKAQHCFKISTASPSSLGAFSTFPITADDSITKFLATS